MFPQDAACQILLISADISQLLEKKTFYLKHSVNGLSTRPQTRLDT